jgi:hypothetical protein
MEEGITLSIDMAAKRVIHKEMMTQKLINSEKVLVFLEGMKCTLAELEAAFFQTLFDWSRAWGFTHSIFILDFVSPLKTCA